MVNNDLNQEPDLQQLIFVGLFKEACAKCFSRPLTEPLTETESKFFSTRIFEATGLVIGVKSVKNYAAYVLNPLEVKKENPSVATLDTLARFVMDAPFTDEIKRKDSEGHFPYWFEYKSRYLTNDSAFPARKPMHWKKELGILLTILTAASIGAMLLTLTESKVPEPFIEHFQSVEEGSLTRNEWLVKLREDVYWRKRAETPGYLTLFTLTGDNWPDSIHSPQIKNLLFRRITSECFAAEVHFHDFFPQHNWQQAGLILLEDTTLQSRSIRLSLGYNDYFGGFSRPAEIRLQVISLSEASSKPEEVAQVPLFSLQSDQEALIKNNLKRVALRIEKRENQFRFLFSTAPLANAAFKEAISRQLTITPKYIGIFAIQGFVNNRSYLPVYIDYFSLDPAICGK